MASPFQHSRECRRAAHSAGRPGDLVYFHGLGYKVLVINSMKAITDLFEKRHSIYSDRPAFTVVGELMRLGQVRRGARRASVLH